MNKIILRIRPEQSIEELDLNVIKQRAMMFKNGEARVHDSRISDAPYITVIVMISIIDDASMSQLKEIFTNLLHMHVNVLQEIGLEICLNEADVTIFKKAACSFSRL